MHALIVALRSALRAALKSRAALALENAALRRLWLHWTRALVIVRPETFIRRITRDHPEWGEDRIAQELAAKFGTRHSGSTIRRYLVPRQGAPRGDQTWRTFVRNHAKEVWAWPWVKQQIREATAWDTTPRFFIHDNYGVFGQFGRTVRLERAGGKRSCRCHLDRWPDEVMGSEGLPIPFGAPHASPHVGRLMRTLREEALNHFIFLSASHVRRVVAEYVRYYNGARPSQAIHGIPDPFPELRQLPPSAGRLVALRVLGGVQHDDRLVA